MFFYLVAQVFGQNAYQIPSTGTVLYTEFADSVWLKLYPFAVTLSETHQCTVRQGRICSGCMSVETGRNLLAASVSTRSSRDGHLILREENAFYNSWKEMNGERRD